MALQNVLLSSGSANAVCEDPVLRAFAKAGSPQFRERCGKTRINGKRLTRRFSFRIASFAVYDSPPNEDRQIVSVEVSPLQAHDFTGAKAQTCSNQNHSVVWLGQLCQKEADLATCEHARYASTAAALSHQVYGIPIGQLPPPCVLINKVKQASKINPGLGRQGK